MFEPLLWIFGLLISLVSMVAYDWRAYRSLTEPHYPIWMMVGSFIGFICYLFCFARLGGIVGSFLLDEATYVDLYINSWPEAVALVVGYLALTLTRNRIESIAIKLREAEVEASGKAGLFWAYSTNQNGRLHSEPVTKEQALDFARRKISEYAAYWRTGREPPGTGMFGFYRVREEFLQVMTAEQEDESSLWFEGTEETSGLFGLRDSFCQYEIALAPRSFVFECIEKFHDLPKNEFLSFFKKEGAGKVS